MNKAYKKMVDWLYRTDDCSDFQRGLRFKMWSKAMMGSLNEIGDKMANMSFKSSYKLKKWSLLKELTK